ncbi:hypothetical protein [Streptomyces sp. NPDC001068]|uniref:hypothetical protein n=1 Tax=Streptomyces sp. NPDC001068 TaxID=3364544 RepID=UPI0036B99BA8
MIFTLVIEYAQVDFEAPAPDVPVTVGATFELPLDGYVVSAEVDEVTITYPVSRIFLSSPAPKGRSFRGIVADLERTEYASNVTVRDLDDDGDD